MKSTIFDTIRLKTKLVATSADFVSIKQEAIDEYIATFRLEEIENPPLDPSAHYLDRGIDTLSFFLILEAVNFGSGYFPYLEKNSEGSGYFTIATALKNHFIHNGPLTAKDLTELTKEDCTQIFKQRADNKPIQELMSLFALSWNQLGTYVCKTFDRAFEGFVLSANHSAEHFVKLLTQVPSFQDISIYKGHQVPFLKRAQIAVADISLAFKNKGLGHFNDLSHLTTFADDMIPHVLRSLGMIEYNEELSSVVDAGDYIPPGSTQEIEIRATSIYVVEVIKEKLQALGHIINSADIDYLLWNKGQANYKHTSFLPHLTKTIFY